jgi:hypothetical protein
MAFTKRTLLWVLVAVIGLGIVGIIAVAGFGMYFVSQHVQTAKSSSTDAFRAFDEVRAKFKEDQPVFDLDNFERPRQLRRVSELPTSQIKTDSMWILAWDPDDQRLAKVSMPYWVLRLGRQKVDISTGGFEFQKLDLDVKDLQRVGPILLFDYRSTSGERVIVWTQ